MGPSSQSILTKGGVVRGGLSDFDLVRRICSGEVQLFAELVERYQAPMLSLSLRYVRDHQQAEDIVQDSFIKAYEKLAGFEFRSSLKSWLYRITINTAKNVLRAQRTNLCIDEVLLAEPATQESDLIDRQLMERAKDLIGSLPDKQQQALRLRVFSDLSFQEVADKLDCPYDTAKANYRHGLLKLQEKLVLTW